jgi:hypothetical protein
VTDGIFNPYAPPKPPEVKKKNFQATTDLANPYNSEYAPELMTRTDISLDGDTYVVVVQNAKVETVAQRLGALLKELAKTHGKELQRYGIEFHPPEHTSVFNPDELILTTPAGILRIDTNGEKNEVVAYRKLGYALSRMNIRDVLKRHAFRVYLRG